MKNVLIVENASDSLKKIDESVVNGEKKYVLGGTFTEFGVKNRNERIYTAEKFIPSLNELKERMNTLGVVFGEFDHPDVFDTSLSRASHIIKSIDYVQEKNSVEGQIQLLSTYWGKEAQAIVNDGCPLFVSSRAAGVTESDGTVSLKKLFTYDIVADPGFGSARMSSINESVGYSNKSNFRIYEMSDESKINELFTMNEKDLVTKNQLGDYSRYLVEEIKNTKKTVNEAVKLGKLDSKKLEELLAYYESLHEDHKKVVEYLDYLASNMQIMVNENNLLKETQEKLIKHNDYLAENLEKTIEYSEYIAENLDKTIEYSEYIAENLDKNIEYSEYIAENLDKTIEYSEYIAENLDSNIAYSEYIAENVEKSIDYSEYIAEHLDNNIAYSEYLAENLDDNIAYSDYIAENLDKSISYSKLIVEKLNTSDKLNENLEEGEQKFPLPEESGFEVIEDEESYEDEDLNDEMVDSEEDEDILYDENGDLIETEIPEDECRIVCDSDEDEEEENEEDDDMGDDEGNLDEIPMDESELESDESESEETMKLDEKIDKLIEEAKKRKASETNEHHFLKFLNKSQIDSFYSLENNEQEQVVSYINEKGNYMSSSDVLKLIKEALSLSEETLEDKLVRLMPNVIVPKWEKLDESAKVSILSQARLYPELTTEQQIEHFWLTRNIKEKDSSRQLVSESKLIQEDKLSEEAINGIMERMRNL